jgi:quercetin dioxygenase-like cupin family protein
MDSSKLFQYGAEMEWDDLGSGVQRKIYGYDQQVMMVVVRFDTGAIGELHEHMHSQVTYVESGVFEMTMGEEKAIIRKGDGYYVPPHVVHGVVCLEPGILIDTFSPHRADFLIL